MRPPVSAGSPFVRQRESWGVGGLRSVVTSPLTDRGSVIWRDVAIGLGVWLGLAFAAWYAPVQ